MSRSDLDIKEWEYVVKYGVAKAKTPRFTVVFFEKPTKIFLFYSVGT
jgi:hypothetical protein